MRNNLSLNCLICFHLTKLSLFWFIIIIFFLLGRLTRPYQLPQQWKAHIAFRGKMRVEKEIKAEATEKYSDFFLFRWGWKDEKEANFLLKISYCCSIWERA